MSLYLQAYNLTSNKNQRICKEMSMRQFQTVYGTFRHLHQDKLNKPSADNNALIAFDLQCQNFIRVNAGMFMILAGGIVYMLKTRLGYHRIDPIFTNYLGERRGNWAQIAFYFGSFFWIQSWFGRQQVFNINPLINPQEPNGWAMLTVVMKLYPNKIDHSNFHRAQQQTQQRMLLHYNQKMEHQSVHFKDNSTEAEYLAQI